MIKKYFLPFLLVLTACTEAEQPENKVVNTTDSATISYPPASIVPIDTADHNKPGPSNIALDAPDDRVPGKDSTGQ